MACMTAHKSVNNNIETNFFTRIHDSRNTYGYNLIENTLYLVIFINFFSCNCKIN